MVLREFILPPPTLITSVMLSHLPPFFANRIIFKCFRMSNEKSEDQQFREMGVVIGRAREGNQGKTGMGAGLGETNGSHEA
jgi:hypothetical protein